MKKLYFLSSLFTALLVCLTSFVNAQGISVNANGALPDSSAMLDVSSNNSGILIPRMTTLQRNNIHAPAAEGLQIFNTTTKCFEFYVNGSWLTLSCGCNPPAAAGNVSGVSSVCQGQSNVNYSVTTIANATGYSWSLPPGASIVSGVNTNSIAVNFGPSSTSGSVTVYGTSSSCGNGSISAAFSVTVISTPTLVTATATPNPVCAGQTLTLTGSASGATSWSWSGPAGFTSAVQNPSAITNVTAPAAGVYTLTASNNGCAAIPASTSSVVVTALPTSVTASANPLSLCEGGTVSLTGNATGATNWSWSGPGGYTSTLQSPVITNINIAGSGVYTLTASNSGCAAPSVNTASVTVNAAPVASAGPNISAGFCSAIGGSPTASGGVSPYTYLWAPSSSLSSATVANPVASPSSTTAYTVTVTGANGCSSSSSMTLTVGSSTSITLTTPQTWTVPAGVSCTQFEVWGAGGGGGFGQYSNQSAGGGGGGGYGKQSFAVTAGNQYTISIGASGHGSQYAADSPAGAGGTTSITGANSISASGGGGGDRSGSAGSGGSSSATVNVTGGSGGVGGSTSPYYGGTGGTGGNGGNGGIGGHYGCPNANGASGNAPGAGGGGGAYDGCTGGIGGAGAIGQVTITY